MTARDDLKAAVKAWDLGSDAHVAGAAMCRAARAVLAEPSAREVLGKLWQWSHAFGAELCPTAGAADTFGDGMRVAKHQVSMLLGDALATLDAPQPGTVEVTDDDLEKVGKELERSRRIPVDRMQQRMGAPQPKAPEPSADARAWRERIETAIAATNEKRTSPLLSCPELTVHGLLDEAMDHWTDATCSGCAAADERARRAEAALGNGPFRAARSEEMRRLREERDLARQQAHEAHERADAVKMQLDDTIGRLAPTRERVYLNATIRTLARLLTEAKR